MSARKPRFPGWRHMTAAQRYNARMDEIFDGAKRLEAAKAKPPVHGYVTDQGDSSRFYRSVYQIIEHVGERSRVRRIGHVMPGGRLDTSGDHGETHRTTANLRAWS